MRDNILITPRILDSERSFPAPAGLPPGYDHSCAHSPNTQPGLPQPGRELSAGPPAPVRRAESG